MIDPVSGNEVPQGALPSEVRDDVDISVSEGEYIVPADVVRFLGLDKLEKLVGRAKEQIAELHAGGRIGGDAPPEEGDELEFSDEDLVVSNDEAPGFAEGGMVSQQAPMFSQEQGFTGVKPFKSKDGKSTMYVPYVNGKALYETPQGYSESSEVAPTTDQPVSAEQPSTPVTDPNRKNYMDSDARRGYGSPLAGDPNKWSVDDFVNYGKQKGGVGEKAVKAISTFVPAARVMMGMRERYLDKSTAELFDKMFETGQDLQGNPLSEEQIKSLTDTRDSLKSKMSEDSGLNLNPFNTLTEAVGKFTDFLGNAPRLVAGQSSTVKPGAGTTRNYKAPDTLDNEGRIPRSSMQPPSESAADRAEPSLSEKTYNDAKRTSGGLYGKGGLVKRRNK